MRVIQFLFFAIFFTLFGNAIIKASRENYGNFGKPVDYTEYGGYEDEYEDDYDYEDEYDDYE